MVYFNIPITYIQMMQPSTPTASKQDNLRFPSPSNYLDSLPPLSNRSVIIKSPFKHKS